jgi:hypothetical protein
MRNSGQPDKPEDVTHESRTSERAPSSRLLPRYGQGVIGIRWTIGTVSEPRVAVPLQRLRERDHRVLTLLGRRGQAPSVWRFAQERRAWRVSTWAPVPGIGWNFYLDVYLAKAVTAVEFVPQMSGFLRG